MSNFASWVSIGGGALLATLTATSAALGAAEPTPTCNGLEATIVIAAGENDSRIEGTEGDDVMVVHGTGTQQIVVDGLSGDDTICTHQVGTIIAGPGDDYVQAVEAPDVAGFILVAGGEGNDEIHGSDEFHDRLGGGPGDDLIYGHGGWDIIGGEDGDDILYGNAGGDHISGGGGKDLIYGGWGEDFLFGGDDIDLAISETPDEADRLYGGPGDDYVVGQHGADTLYGGLGDDMLISNEPQDLATLDGTTPREFLDDAGARMFGGPGNDLIVGTNRWDRIQGGPGDDTMWGFEGRDYIRGGSGSDAIIGGLGIDDTNGNTGNDHLVQFGAEITNGGFGLDRCESPAWPNQQNMRSCERLGLPTLDYTPPDTYVRLREGFLQSLELFDRQG